MGPPLLCHPLVLKAPAHLAVRVVQVGQTPQTHCYHRWASQEDLGGLEGQGGQAFPSCRTQGWHLQAPLSLPLIHLFQDGPAVQGSRFHPCARVAHKDPAVLESLVLPWLLSGCGPGLCHQGQRQRLALPSHPWALEGPARLWNPGHPSARQVRESLHTLACPRVLECSLLLYPHSTHRPQALEVLGGQGGLVAPLHLFLGLPFLPGSLSLLSAPGAQLHLLFLGGQGCPGLHLLRLLP